MPVSKLHASRLNCWNTQFSIHAAASVWREVRSFANGQSSLAVASVGFAQNDTVTGLVALRLRPRWICSGVYWVAVEAEGAD